MAQFWHSYRRCATPYDTYIEPMTTTANPPRLLDSTELSAWLGVPVPTLNQWAYRSVGPRFVKVGRHRRYRPEDVERWLDARTRGGDVA